MEASLVLQKNHYDFRDINYSYEYLTKKIANNSQYKILESEFMKLIFKPTIEKFLFMDKDSDFIGEFYQSHFAECVLQQISFKS